MIVFMFLCLCFVSRFKEKCLQNSLTLPVKAFPHWRFGHVIRIDNDFLSSKMHNVIQIHIGQIDYTREEHGAVAWNKQTLT